jgi:WG containing repeat
MFILSLPMRLGELTPPEPAEWLMLYKDNVTQLWGYVNLSGRVVIPARFGLNADFFSEGLAKVSPGMSIEEIKDRMRRGIGLDPSFGMTGYIDKRGRFVISPQFKSGRRFSEGLAAVAVGIDGEKWGFIDRAGHFAINPKFDDEPSEFKDGLSRVKQSGLYGFINKQGEWVVKPTYGDASDFREGLAGVRSK